MLELCSPSPQAVGWHVGGPRNSLDTRIASTQGQTRHKDRLGTMIASTQDVSNHLQGFHGFIMANIGEADAIDGQNLVALLQPTVCVGHSTLVHLPSVTRKRPLID